jgi:dUTP pyrophosphatase
MSLYVYVENPNVRAAMEKQLKNRRWTDSGFDIVSSTTTLDFMQTNIGVELRLGCIFAALDDNENPVPYLLLARSSTSLTPLRMSNQIGLADSGYRGELIARVDYFGQGYHYDIEFGRRLFQVVQHNWLPWKTIVFVDNPNELPAALDNRGAGGFGSTGQ